MAQQNSARPLPNFFVGKDVTTKRIENYLTQKNNLLSKDLGKTDTKSIWYSKDHIRRILDEIESVGGDGLRIYLGAYESTHEFAGQLCLLMVSTKANDAAVTPGHLNVYLEDQPDFAERSALPRTISAFPIDGGSKDFNFGSPCPPRCT